MRKPFIAGNWKMHNTIVETIELLNILKRELVDFEAADIVVCPPFTALPDARDVLLDSNIGLGAQDMHWEKKGAFTGAVSGPMLKDAGCRFVIIGHSERRKYFFESDASVNKKIKAALSEALLPIVCVGETLEEREAGKTIEVVTQHLTDGLSGLSASAMCSLIIAYEPVWAIGTGRTATPPQAQEVHAFIRGWILKLFGQEVAAQLRILYGGSVKPSNIKELMQQPDIDGSLVGGASLESGAFTEIIRNSV